MTHMPELARRLCLPLLAAGLLVGCRTAQPKGAGALIVTPLYNPSAIPVYLGVDGPHLFGHGADAKVDFDLELQQDGCARGAVNGNPIEVCPVPGQPGPGRDRRARRALAPAPGDGRRRLVLRRVRAPHPRLVHAGLPHPAPLTFVSGAPGRLSRYTYRFESPTRYAFKIESSRDGSAWTPFMEASYGRD